MTSILTSVLTAIDEARARGVLPICVFDLDGTLLLTRSRTLRILADFAEKTGRTALAEAVAGIAVEEQGYGVFDPLAERIELDDAEKAAILAWWRGHFFTDDWCLQDDVQAGASEFVNACWERGAFVYYLTGRHIHGMEEGTIGSLVLQGFPIFGGRALLHLKPDFDTPDEPYKLAAIEQIQALNGEVVATFENEPANANIFQGAFPGAANILVGSTHRADAPPPDAAVLHVDDFQLG